MSTAALKTGYKKYFNKLLFFVISFLFFFSEQSQSQCTSVSIYDRIVSGYHSTLAVKTDGKIALWGENLGFGFVNQLTPWELDPLGSATAIMGTIGGGSDGGYDQVIVLTSDGLYALGYNTGEFGSVLPTNLTPSTNFQKITQPLGGNSYGLPSGIVPDDVASIFATYKTLLIVTKNDRLNGNPRRYGEVWIITQTSKAVEANGDPADNVASSSWKQVRTEIGIPLTNITAARGQVSPIPSSSQYYSAFMALAANGDVFTWGNTTYLGNATNVGANSYATKMALPSEFSASNVPKMIGVTGGTKFVISSTTAYAKNTYYLLSNSGRLYTLGDNSKKQCGDFSTDERKSWVNVKSSNSTDFTNINFISVQEHTSGVPCASAITADGKLYTWGEDNGGMLARGTTLTQSYDPGVALGSGGSTALFSEMGGHTLIYLKMGSERFCYVGHKSRGSMGDNKTYDEDLTSFDCDNGPIISICGSVSALVIPSNPGIITGPTPVCPAATGQVYSINAVANAATYVWNVPTGWIITAGQGTNSITVTAGSFGQNGSISVYASNSFGRSIAESTLAVTVSERPSPTFLTQAGVTICASADVTYTTESGKSNYIWTVPGVLNTDYTITSGDLSSTSNSVTLRWLTTGSKILAINYSNSNNCNASSATSSNATMVNARPNPTFTTQAGAAICANTDVTYTTQSNQANYLWTIPGILNTDYTITPGGTTSSNSVTLKWLTAGIKTVTINYSNSNNCNSLIATSSTASTVNASATPTFTSQPGSTACLNADVTYTTESGQSNYIWNIPGNPNINYSITSGGTSSSTVTLKWLTTGVKTVTINYTNSNSCNASVVTSSTATTVSTRPTPTFSSQPGANACASNSVTYTTQSAQLNYIWTLPGTLNTDYTITSGGTGTSSNTVTLKWLTAGSKTVTINYSNSNNCNAIVATSSTPTMANVKIPTFTVQPGATVCANTNVTYTTESAQSNYSWGVPGTLGTDYTITSGGIGSTSYTVTLKWLTVGSKTVSINYSSNPVNCNGVVATLSTPTIVSARPSPTFTTQPGATACVSGDVTYTTETGQANYIWVVPGTLNIDYAITSGGIDNASNTVTLKWLTAGVKTVTINYTNSNNCNAVVATSSTATTIIAKPIPTFTTQAGAAACVNADVTYTSEPGQSNYLWTVPGILNTDYSITLGGIGTASNTVTLKWLTAGVKTVTINYTNSNSCTAASASSSIATTVSERPIPTFTTEPGGAACASTDVTYTTESGQTNYVWTGFGTLNTDYTITSGGIGTTSNTVTLKWLTAGIKTVTINYFNSSNCTASSATSSTATTVSARPVPTFTTQPGVAACTSTDVIYATETGQTNYLWSVSGTLNIDYSIVSGGIGTTSNTVTLKWLTTGIKTVTINYTNSNGCNASAVTSSNATTASPRPTPTFTTQPGAAVCASTDVTYTTESAQSNYTWGVPGTLGTDYTITSGGIGTTSNTVTLKWLIAGIKTVTINYTNLSSCPATTATSSIATTVSARSTPTFTTQPGAAACASTDVTYTTEPSQTNYVWIVPGTLNTDYTITSGGIDNASNTVILKWLTAGVKTVTINYTNSNNCNAVVATSSTATTISARPIPAFTTQPGATACANADVTYTTESGQTNYVWTGFGTLNTDYTITSGGISTASNTVTLKWLTAGVKTVTINYTNVNSCTASSATSSIATTVSARPIPTFTTEPGGAACASTDVTYTTESGQTNYVWTGFGTINTDYTITSGSIGTASNTVTLKWLTAGIKTVTINYTDVNNCNAIVAASSTATTVSARPVPTFTTQPGVAACASTDVTYTTESGQSNYIWTIPGAPYTDFTITSGGSTTSNTITLKWLTAGIKTVTINYTNLNSCTATSATSSTATTVSARPVPTFTTEPGANACANADVTYTTESGQTNYVWTGFGTLNTDYTITSGGIGTASNNVTLKWLTAGVKTVTINYTNVNSCTAASATSSTATTVSARSTPTFTTQPGAAACENADVTYTTEPGQTNYVWIVPGTLNTDYNIVSGGIDNASNTVTLKWLTAGIKTVTINYTNSNNCNAVVATSSTATTVSTRPIPAFTTQPGSTACPNADVTYTTEAGQSNYVWLVPGILNTDYSITSGGIGTTSNTVTLKWLTTGIKTVTINYTNANSCTSLSATSSTATTVSARPSPTFTTQPGSTVCANTNVTYTTEPGQTNYVWTGFGTLNTDYTITSGGTAITNTVTLKWLTAGVKTVAINYSNSNNCTALSATSSSATTVNAAPTPSFIAEPGATACPNADVTYTTQSSQSNYIWAIPGTPYIDYFISGGSTTSNTVTLRWLTTGTKTVTINYTNSNSCIAESATSSTATVVNALPSPSFIAQPGANACPGIDVTYSTQSSQANYIWTVPGNLGTDYTITSGGIGTTSNTVTFKWLTTGTKTVTINYSNSNNCTAASASSSTATSVNALPAPSFIAQPGAAVCASASVTYTTEASQSNYIWTFTGTLNTDYTIVSGGGASSNTVTLKWLTAGNKTVTINYTNSNSCTAASATSSSATTVNVLPAPSFTAEPGVSACPNADVVYTTQSSQTNYVWSVPGTLNTDYSITSGGIDNASNTVTLKWLTTGTKTVTINYTNSNSCTAIAATSSLATVVNALPIPSFIVQPGVRECPNTNVTYSTQPSQSNYIWSVPGTLNTDYSITSGGIGNTSNTVTLKWVSSGSKMLTINYSNSNNCTAASATSSTATTISAINTVGNASSTPTICINMALTSITHLTTGATDIANSGIAGTNGLPPGVSASWASNTITISGTPSSSGTFNYSIPLTGGCGAITATGSIVVTANNVIALSSAAGTDNQTNCINTAIASIAYSTTGATGITFAGLPAGVTGSSTSNNVIISGTPSAAGVFNYTVALTGGCGVISAQGTIKVNALPVAAIISPSTTLLTCSATAINLTATGGVSYLWTNGLGTASTSSITAPGTYMVTVTDANICSSTASITITQNIVVPSSYAVTGTGSYCSGGAGLPIGLAGSQIGVQYQLQANGINTGIAIAGTGSAINFGNKLAAGTYSVIATNTISSCTNSMTGTALVKVLNLPVAGLITGATIQCAGVAGQTYKIASISNATTYNWTVPIGWTINSIQGDTLLTVTTGQVGQDGDIKLVPGNVCGLASATTLAVAVLPMSTSSISSGSANQTICINTALANTEFSTTGATSASFSGLPAGVTGNWSNNTIMLSGSPALAGSFIYTISLIGGCKIVDQTGEINVIPDNKVSLSSTVATDSQNICIGNAITQIEYATISATGIIVTGLPAGLQAVYASNKITIAGTPAVVGVFNYSILLQGGCGQVTANGTVSIHALPIGTVVASNNGIICEGASVLLSATGGNNYQWYFNGNPIAGVAAAAYSASLPGMYSVKLISDKGCANFVKNTPTLILNSAPVVGFSFDKYCINTPIHFSNTSTTNLSGPVSMLWDFGDNTSASIVSPTHSFLIEKANTVKLTITPANCPLLAKSVSKNVQIEIPPKGIKYPTVYALKNNNTQLSARAGGKIYSWSPFIGLNNPAIKSPFFNYTAPTNYQVQITNDAGCIYRDSVNVLIFDQADFFVPKAFSPNNDGHNDKLLFVMPGIEKLAYFRIFNRWGNLVFETTNVNINWDGMFRGVAQPSESYSWFAEGISNLGNKIQRNGQILLLH